MPLLPPPRKRKWHKPLKKQGGRRANPAFYNSWAWRKLSKSFREANPLCVECLKKGIYTPSQVADHITRIEDGGDPLDVNNLQALCHKCHNAKSGKERHGYKADPNEL